MLCPAHLEPLLNIPHTSTPPLCTPCSDSHDSRGSGGAGDVSSGEVSHKGAGGGSKGRKAVTVKQGEWVGVYLCGEW